MSNYHKYIASKEWSNRRLDFLAKKGHLCERCFCTNNLHVHHCTYKNLGNEKDDDLAVLCRTCHSEYHSRHKNPTVTSTQAFIKLKKIVSAKKLLNQINRKRRKLKLKLLTLKEISY